ncbi:aldehyde dehydrogenase family protein [Acholeplasma laidlawii]|uniref:Aldehyde dehydrogenase n=4 Tax=Acholeplasma laidlawii TaxID=2148 RepID=A9NHU7_ACHLI|nr:aldehyde dehydrogenase family protein [Acholeplasma laidlawii]ABX81927.1 putative aldehyde dehydrogenase [Acholeplasma laidlawii PG-8A]NWH12295.1 aldehyde dehydrogenase family protein [Acholeplasma laidlawii]NWH13681.1 aldehyde dehydrogenase family protein [Acholeplasma laidlawii]NWH15074.1 aldehyde dehydrogenase family protein [Acholeplasma laidlawii]OAN20240.1 aldehyde dehydrogenase [Acholeplasma laidlawii]
MDGMMIGLIQTTVLYGATHRNHDKSIYEDLHKSAFESYSTEIGYVLKSITKTIKSLKKWMKPKRVKTPIYLRPTTSYIAYEPKGVILIIGPYNYPFQLILEPLIGAIAAGNTASIKPSEYASHTEQLLQTLINDHFEPSYLHVITGDHKITENLLENKFDHIFFTGSTRVGKLIYEQASKHLTPVTLELGGKSPTIVDQSANLKVAAKRIIFGKFINAGQTCIAPDYIYVHQTIAESFIKILSDTMHTMYNDLHQFGRIINDKHFDRLMNLIDADKVLQKPVIDAKMCLISPTIMKGVTWTDKVMQEEIFGPLLPVLIYDDIDTLIKLLKTKEKPLALYVFTNNKDIQHKVFSQLSFGGGAMNDTIMHVSNPCLPFGGVGQSGMGAYHYFASFEIFSHKKSYIKRCTWLYLPLVYPPYTKSKENIIKKILK